MRFTGKSRWIGLCGTLLLLAAACAAEAQIKPLIDAAESQRQAEELLRQGMVTNAVSLLQQVQKAEPNRPGLRRLLGIAYYRQGDFVRASETLERVTQADPADKEAIQLLGLAYYRSGKPEKAIPLLEAVQSWFPSANVDASYVLGVTYLQARQFDKSRAAFARMYGVEPESAASHLFFARMLLRQEFDPVAEEHARRAIALDARLPLAHLLLGEIYMYKSMIPEAIAEFEEERKLNPGHAATYYKLGDAYSRAQRFEEAQQALQHSIWLDATASGPFTLMGKVLLRKGETELAAATLQKAAAMDPNNVMAHHLLGEAYQAMGKTADAERERTLAQKLQSAQNPKPD